MKRIADLAKKIDPPIDYIGQHLANRIVHTTLIVSVGMAFISGHIYKDIFVMGYAYACGSLVALAVVVPSWPIYRRNPVSSLPEKIKSE